MVFVIKGRVFFQRFMKKRLIFFIRSPVFENAMPRKNSPRICIDDKDRFSECVQKNRVCGFGTDAVHREQNCPEGGDIPVFHPLHTSVEIVHKALHEGLQPLCLDIVIPGRTYQFRKFPQSHCMDCLRGEGVMLLEVPDGLLDIAPVGILGENGPDRYLERCVAGPPVLGAVEVIKFPVDIGHYAHFSYYHDLFRKSEIAYNISLIDISIFKYCGGEMLLQGRVWKFGNDVDTDAIIPARYLNTSDPDELAKHVMEDADRDFPQKVKRGDILVAGKNFGCGSSREHAPIAIKAAGIHAVIAKSFARIFYRNAFNIGLPIFESSGASEKIREGDEIEVDADRGIIRNRTTNETYDANPIPPFMQELIAAGGLVEWTKRKLKVTS